MFPPASIDPICAAIVGRGGNALRLYAEERDVLIGASLGLSTTELPVAACAAPATSL